MKSLPAALRRRIERRLGGKVVQAEAVSGGCISETALVLLEGGRSCFAKWDAEAPCGFFAAEAAGLCAIRAAGAPAPEVFESSAGDLTDDPPSIIMEALEPARRTQKPDDWRALARVLAVLHSCAADSFGFETDNFLGRLPQKNERSASWGEFFVHRRLGVQADIGERKGWFDKRLRGLLREKGDAICAALDEHAARPVMLHGDLWSGNVFWSTSGPVLIDPAVYFGCREADLAMSELFGGFGEAFYEEYGRIMPLAPGYAARRDLLNLYHLMNHASHFGGSYVSSVRRRLEEI